MTMNDHQEVMNMLEQVPGVKEYLASPSIAKGKAILKRRFDLGLTQTELVNLARDKGIIFNQATLSKAESGHEGITNGTFDKIVEALGGMEDIHIKFKELPKRRELMKL